MLPVEGEIITWEGSVGSFCPGSLQGTHAYLEAEWDLEPSFPEPPKIGFGKRRDVLQHQKKKKPKSKLGYPCSHVLRSK